MKNICFLVMLTLMFSCTDTQIELKKLEIGSLNDFVPIQNFSNYSKVVYVDLSGNEKELIISHSLSTERSEIEGIEYEREIESFSLTDSQNSEYILHILMSSHYHDVSTIVQSLDCSLLTKVNNGWIPSIRINEEGNTRVGSRKDITLGSKDFFDVFTNLELPEVQTKYSKIFYNFEFGFVGFYDSDNNLWYLDRYEE